MMIASQINKYSEHQVGAKEIAKYMQKRDIPEWFRGISKFQCAASSKLFEALLYDGEQRSTHRVRACLTALGLRPPVSKEQLKKLMQLSRGNDLAFLWFLLESHYKSKGPGYTINEQIIYSCLAHLDMVTTLRELDRLLPYNPSMEQKFPKKRNKQKIVLKPTKLKQFRLKRFSYSPYLEDIATPTVYQRLQTKRPDMKISLDEYEVYKDPTYIVRNESNRWFATYKPKLSKRIVGRILRDEIERVLENGNEISKELENKVIVCQNHKRLIDAEIKRKCDLEKKARSDINDYFDVDGKRELRTKERVTAQIERDVRMFRQKFRYDDERTIHPDPMKKKQKIEILDGIDSIRYCELKIAKQNECEESENSQEDDDNDDDDDDDESGGEELNSKENDRTSKNDLCRKISMPSFCDILRKSKDYDCFFRELCEPSASRKNSSRDEDQYFFKANQKHRPWYFDYQKIFNINHTAPTIEQRVKLLFVKALNSQMSLSTDINGNVDIEKAFDTGFKKQWSESVEEYNRRVVPPIKVDDGHEVPIRFDRNHFDPNDKAYMVYMLKCCFDRMKKDPKFVLASLPDAHKIPSLLYFIQDRYGKRYSFEERQNVFAESLKILRALGKLTKVAPAPKIQDIPTASNISYACWPYLLAKGEKVRQKYYEELDQIIMNEARIFWFSMRPYLFTSGPPRNTYFAYMPPRTGALTRYRQWKPSEFMDAKAEWDRRQKLAKRRI